MIVKDKMVRQIKDGVTGSKHPSRGRERAVLGRPGSENLASRLQW